MRLLASVLPLALVSGCVGISEGTIETSQKVLMTSTPSNARVMQSDRLVCRTPCRAERRSFRVGEGFQFIFEDGNIVEVAADYKGSSAVVGNVIAGGLIGLAFDAASGRLQVRPDHIHVDLTGQQPQKLR